MPSDENSPLDLFRALDERVRRLHAEETSLDDTLDRIVTDVVAHVPGAEHASLSQTARRRTIVTVAASDDVGRDMDAAQNRAGQGPCVTSLYDRTTIVVEDWQTDERWPKVRPAYLGSGLRSGLAFQLYLADQDLGALNLFSSVPGAFDETSIIFAEHFATHAALAMRGAATRDQLRKAVESRDVIGQAKGILMARHGVTADQAFQVLVRYSRDRNVKLARVAEELTSTGALSGPVPDPTTGADGAPSDQRP